jgi:hypothetical protein
MRRTCLAYFQHGTCALHGTRRTCFTRRRCACVTTSSARCSCFTRCGGCTCLTRSRHAFHGARRRPACRVCLCGGVFVCVSERAGLLAACEKVGGDSDKPSPADPSPADPSPRRHCQCAAGQGAPPAPVLGLGRPGPGRPVGSWSWIRGGARRAAGGSGPRAQGRCSGKACPSRRRPSRRQPTGPHAR